MGNKSSQPQAEGLSETAFSLSGDLQAQIVQDYNNEQIIKMFGKQVNSLEEKKSERLRGSREERANLSMRMEQFRAQNNIVQKNLDATIESLEDRFTDLGNVMEYDAKRLEGEYLGSSGKSAKSPVEEIPCLKVRTSVSACFAESGKNISVCDGLVQALEECVATTITNKAT